MSSSIKIGSRVSHRFNEGDPDEGIEFGVVVHIWESENGVEDAYVAFFGDSFPEGKPKEKPCILRYYTSSLDLVD